MPTKAFFQAGVKLCEFEYLKTVSFQIYRMDRGAVIPNYHSRLKSTNCPRQNLTIKCFEPQLVTLLHTTVNFDCDNTLS